MPELIERTALVLKYNCDDHCLGRQFSQLLSGYTNAQRGAFLRRALAAEIDSGKTFEGISPDNFAGFRFRQNKEFAKLPKKKQACEICGGIFENLDKLAARIAKRLEKVSFDTFLLGTRISKDLHDREEDLWTNVGIDYTEPIRAELNREIGKRVEKLAKKEVDLKRPDVSVLLDLGKNKIELKSNPLFIFGYYKKLKRGFPQCRWGTPRKYKTSVEQRIGEPLLKLTGAKDHRFHGAGREDIDALCLDWRAFVIEAVQPKNRHPDLKKLKRLAAKGNKVKVTGLEISDMDTVRKIKAATPNKTYRALVTLSKSVKPKDLKRLLSLIGTIKQRTPARVAHRRADIERRRKVLSIKWKRKGPRKLELLVEGTSGLYIKELVSGDNGRTKPSVAEVLGAKAKVKNLDVIKIQKMP